MLCLNLKSTDPYFNLAAEEFLLRTKSDDYLILYIDSPSVIIGKHQVAHREADTKYVFENNIPVIRRISGGGTVYHDSGNLNFSFITQSDQGKQVDFRKYTLPIIKYLEYLGVTAYFEGKNDLRVNGLKISGNAEHVFHERVLHHGTLLFDTNLQALGNSLRKNLANYTSRAVSSNPSSVMNLKEILPGVQGIEGLRKMMIEFFLNQDDNNMEVSLEPDEFQKIVSIAESKYWTWEWNFAYGPEYQFVNNFEFDNRPHHCRLMVKDGIINQCKIEGSDRMRQAADKLTGCRHMIEDMLKILEGEQILYRESDIFNFF
jgi:lipoate-protein ligase A